MSEPVYSFVKGKGWILSAEPFIEMVFACGKRCLMIDRKPNPGERYRCANRTGYDFVTAGKADLLYWSDDIKSEGFETCGICREHTVNPNDMTSYYVTVVPV